MPTAPILTVAPEKLTSFEVGVKSEWLDRKLRFNASAFHYLYDPLQVRVTTGLNQFKIVNASASANAKAKAKVDGREMDFAAAVNSRLQLTGNVSLLKARYTSFCDNAIPLDRPANCHLPGTTGANTGVERAGDPLNQAPKVQANLGFSYRQPLSNGRTLNLDGSYSYQNTVYFAPGQNQYTRGESIRQDQPACRPRLRERRGGVWVRDQCDQRADAAGADLLGCRRQRDRCRWRDASARSGAGPALYNFYE